MARLQAFFIAVCMALIAGSVGAVLYLYYGFLRIEAAVIAVAAVGFLMLTGRIEWKRGLVVVIGCFIIFGAAAIVAGIRQVAGVVH